MDTRPLPASVPTASMADMASRRRSARRGTLVCRRKGPPARDDETRDERLQREHLQHRARLQMVGKSVLNGPSLGDHDILGVSAYATRLAEARAVAQADPKVPAGYLTVEAIPWLAVPRDTDPD